LIINSSIDILKIESELYALIDAEGMRGKYKIRKRFNLGGNHSVNVRINNFFKKPLQNHYIIKNNEFVFSLHFSKNNQEWFRVDNESIGFLHFHKDDLKQHQKIEKQYTVSELISFTFNWTYDIIKEKFPNEIIQDSPGFIGFA